MRFIAAVAILMLLLIFSALVCAETPLSWTIKSSSGSIKCPIMPVNARAGAGSIGTVFDDHGMIVLAPGMVSANLACEGTHEVVLETQSFTHDPNTPLTLSAHIPIYSGSQVSLGVDGTNFEQISDATWFGSSKGDCVKDLKVRSNNDPTSSGTPVFSPINFGAIAWADGKAHQLTLKVEKKDSECPATVILLGNISEAPASTTTFAEKTGDEEGQGLLQLHGRITDPWSNPMKNVVVEFDMNEVSLTSSTDENGEYLFEFEAEMDPDSYREGILSVKLAYMGADGKTYFRIMYGDEPVTLRHPFRLMEEKDLNHDLKVYEFMYFGAEKSTPDFDGFGVRSMIHDYAAMYFHLTQALEFYKDYLGWRVDHELPVDVYSFVIDSGTYYTSTHSSIIIDFMDSGVSDSDRPMNREWHEFGHHAMFSTYGKWPHAPEGSYPKEENHAGYINPSTSDSFVEGFAEFGSMMIAGHYGIKRPDVYQPLGSFEADYTAWTNMGRDEEKAIAGILWDLADPKNDDNVDLTDKQVFDLLKTYHKDFTSVYDALQKKFPHLSSEIDEVFVRHGFFADRTLGNGKRDPQEPYVNYYNKSRYVEGVEYVDYAMEGKNNTPGMEYQKGDLIGAATNYQRPKRTSAGKALGHYIKVSDKTPYYVATVTFPDNPELDYSVTAENNQSLIYVEVPPQTYKSTITIKALNASTKKPLTFSSDEFYEKLHESIEKGFFMEHDFEVLMLMPDEKAPQGIENPLPDSKPHWETRDEEIKPSSEKQLSEAKEKTKGILEKIVEFIKKLINTIKSRATNTLTASDGLVCNPPYMRFEKDCCLDTNQNKICDKHET